LTECRYRKRTEKLLKLNIFYFHRALFESPKTRGGRRGGEKTRRREFARFWSRCRYYSDTISERSCPRHWTRATASVASVRSSTEDRVEGRGSGECDVYSAQTQERGGERSEIASDRPASSAV